MPNSQSINQTLPNFATTKNSTSAPELKTNSNNFNQVLKNEVVNKAKKINTEPQKNISAQNTKVYAAPNDTSKTVIDEEKTELQDTNKHDISDQEEQLPNNLSDPGSLLAFVNTVSALAKTSVEDATYNKTDLTISGMEQPINSTQLSPPITDNNKINTKELIEADQFRLEPDASDNANSTTSTSKSNAPSRIDTRDMLTAAHQVNAKDLDSSASAPASTSTSAPASTSTSTSTSASASASASTSTSTSASASTSESESAPAPASALDIIKEQKNSLELLQTAPLNTTPGKIGISTNVKIMDTKDSTVLQQSKEITQNSQELPISTTSDGGKFTKALNDQLTQEKQDVLKPIKSEARNELSLSANEPQRTDISSATPAIPAPPAVMGNTTIIEHISPRVGSKGWDQAIGQKIVWMVAGGEQSAQLTLNPPDLGPVQVVLSINDNFVDASFVSSHLDVREAIEAAAPKLREMMDNAGISLSGFSVSAESAQSGNPFNSEKFQHNGNSGMRGADTTPDTEADNPKLSTSTQNSRREQGLVDTFA